MSRRLVTLAVFCFCVVLTGPVFASHYLLADVEGDFAPELVDAFERFGCEDTEDALRWILTPDDRRSFASSTGLSPVLLDETAQMLDLMQVRGVGPRAARLLIATGVQSAADLASRDVETLLAEVENVNMLEGLTTVSPSFEHVEAWVDAATRVPLRATW